MKTFWAFGLVALMSVPTTVWADNVALTSEPAAVQQAKAIKGNVVDENGEPMVGVTVKIVGVNGGAVTDLDGNFTVTGAEGRQLQLSYTGYKTQTVSASQGMRIVMEPDVMGLDDVVVIGYGTMKKRDLTGGAYGQRDGGHPGPSRRLRHHPHHR